MQKVRTIAVEKSLAAATAYDAEDVISESASAGTVWTFSNAIKSNGGKGCVSKVVITSETTALTPRLVLFLYKATPTCASNDHAANTAPVYADVANLIGVIEMPAMTDRGTGNSYTVATPSTYGNVPLEFECTIDDADIIAVVMALDAFTQGATKKMTISLTIEVDQY
jgi:hypothetical protein